MSGEVGQKRGPVGPGAAKAGQGGREVSGAAEAVADSAELGQDAPAEAGAEVEGPGERQYTTGEIADLLQVSYSAVKGWVAQGLIGTTRTLGGHHRVSQTELDRIRKEMKL